MERVRAQDYRRRIPSPSSGLICDAFRHSLPASEDRSQDWSLVRTETPRLCSLPVLSDYSTQRSVPVNSLLEARSSASFRSPDSNTKSLGANYRNIEERLRKELLLLSSSVRGDARAALPVERFRVYREAATQLSLQMVSYAPVVREIFDEYHQYIDNLERECQSVTEVASERDMLRMKLEDVVREADARVAAVRMEVEERISCIQNTLKTHRNVEQLVLRIRQLDQLVEQERSKTRELEDQLNAVGHLRVEFEKSLLNVEESFELIANERDFELADHRRERLSTYEEMVRLKDKCRQTVADMQLRLDAQQIVLEAQMQREQLTTDRLRDMQLYNLTLLQQTESLKKQLSVLSARVTTDDGATNQPSETAADTALVQLSTPRPNKAEIIARMPDLGDPSRYPSTNAIIQAMMAQFDQCTRRLADADHTLNRLEERIEMVVLARAELLSREKLDRLTGLVGASELLLLREKGLA